MKPLAVICLLLVSVFPQESPVNRPLVAMRGIYGGMPSELMQDGKTLRDYGVNAVFMGSGSITAERVQALRAAGARLFAEFNSMHDVEFLKGHPDAAPVGADGRVEAAPDGWQGICPTHPEYRRQRMDAFRA